MRRALLFAVPAIALVVILVIGLGQAGNQEEKSTGTPALTRAEVLEPLTGAPPRLAALHARGSTLVEGALPAYQRELRALRGLPVVVNLWASWCGPCRFELPFIQRVAREQGKEIAFLGVDVGDNRPAAERTAREFFMPYPSIEDPRTAVRAEIGAQGLPAMAFYDARGELQYLHQGAYANADALRKDIRQYARGGA